MTWWQYLLLVNVYLLLFYGFYALLLRGETFFRLNRIYLVGSAILSFVIPAIQADWLRNLFITQKINQTIYQLDAVTITGYQPQASSSISVGQILAVIYIIGAILLLTKLTIQLLRLRRAFDTAEKGQAFSFFGNVKLDETLDRADVVAAHEDVHARQWHSADVLLIELITIINWFNPVIYLYRKAVKHIHEFIADSEIINGGTEKQTYAMLLLSQSVNVPVNQLANSFFNHSLLKQRIMMLQKNPSRRRALLKYGLSAPLFAMMIILSSATAKTNHIVLKINRTAENVMQFEATSDLPDLATNFSAKGMPAHIKVFKFIRRDTTSGPIFTSVEQSAMPASGIDQFYKFLGANVRYPAEARRKNIQGRVIMQFIVEKDGSLSHIKVVRGIGGGCDQEATRVLELSPKWTAGRQNGKAVRQQYTIPISFSIMDGKTNRPVKVTEVHVQPPATKDSKVSVVTYVTDDKKFPPPPPASPTGKPMLLHIDTTGKSYNMNFTGPKSPVYFVNDVEVKNLDDVKPDDIESISVFKAKQGTFADKDQIRIRLKKKN